MQRISITNPQNIIDGTAKKYYFKLRNTGGPKGDKGDKGDTGATGPQGPKGDAATVAVGSTTTLAVGQDATVENVGSIYNAVLNFGIPQGPQGPQGAKGDKGDTGAQGETGPRGPQGEKGTNATVYIGTTSTLNPGSQATVYNSGTDSNAVLNFGIPKGEKGDTGPMPTIAQTTGQAIDQVMSQKATTDALNTKQATISSSNKLSADLVTDTSTTNKFVTAEDKTTWNAKQDALTAGNNINIEDGVISTPAIAPEVVAELPETGAEGKLYLTPKNYTRGTGTGNPITATITDEAGQMDSFKLDGDTYQQTYTGINLARNAYKIQTVSGVTFTASADGSITANGTATDRIDYYIDSPTKYSMAAGTYVLSTGGSDGTSETYFVYVDNITGQNWSSRADQSNTITSGSNFEASVRIVIRSGVVMNNVVFKIQIESGSTPTTFQPYVGGTPSPNPDYPQPIQTVTGLQTITINGTNYPLDLGDIQLCGLGDDGNGNPLYKDRIYRDGEDWKVHRATNRAKLGDKNWENYQSEVIYNARASEDFGIVNLGNPTLALVSNIFTASTDSSITWRCYYNGQNDHLNTYGDSTYLNRSGSSAKQWLSDNNAELLYALATPTDTTITDTTLIAQLEAIRTALLENGTNTITNTATGSNLAGDMEIGYYGYNPRNRYDKFIWLDLNNNYEQIGS